MRLASHETEFMINWKNRRTDQHGVENFTRFIEFSEFSSKYRVFHICFHKGPLKGLYVLGKFAISIFFVVVPYAFNLWGKIFLKQNVHSCRDMGEK